MDYPDVRERLLSHIKKHLSPERFRHCVSTSEVLAGLCLKFGKNIEYGIITGLAHDIAREFTDVELINTAARDGLPICKWEKDYPVLLHGRAGAEILKSNFEISESSILDAVRVHSTGSPDMDDFAKLLYISDYIEPLRKHSVPVKPDRIDGFSLDKIVLMILENTINYLKSNERPIAEPSILLYDKLIRRNSDRMNRFEKEN